MFDADCDDRIGHEQAQAHDLDHDDANHVVVMMLVMTRKTVLAATETSARAIVQVSTPYFPSFPRPLDHPSASSSNLSTRPQQNINFTSPSINFIALSSSYVSVVVFVVVAVVAIAIVAAVIVVVVAGCFGPRAFMHRLEV